MTKQQRQKNLLPDGKPRYIRVYDNGGTEYETADRYSCIFTGNYTRKTGGEHWYLFMSAHPFHPQGVGSSGSSKTQIDVGGKSWGGVSIGRKCANPKLGFRIAFDDLPPDCQKLVLEKYCYLWDAVPIEV